MGNRGWLGILRAQLHRPESNARPQRLLQRGADTPCGSVPGLLRGSHGAYRRPGVFRTCRNEGEEHRAAGHEPLPGTLS